MGLSGELKEHCSSVKGKLRASKIAISIFIVRIIIVIVFLLMMFGQTRKKMSITQFDDTSSVHIPSLRELFDILTENFFAFVRR